MAQFPPPPSIKLGLKGNLYLGLLVLHAGGNGHDGVDELHHARVAAVAVAPGHHLSLS